MLKHLESLFRAKYGQDEREVVRRILSPTLVESVEEAFEITVTDGIPVGLDSIDLQMMGNSFPMIVIYVNKEGDDFDVMLSIDLSNPKAPLFDSVARNTRIRDEFGALLSADSKAFAKLADKDKASSYYLVEASQWIEQHNHDVHFIFKLPDEVDTEIRAMVAN